MRTNAAKAVWVAVMENAADVIPGAMAAQAAEVLAKVTVPIRARGVPAVEAPVRMTAHIPATAAPGAEEPARMTVQRPARAVATERAQMPARVAKTVVWVHVQQGAAAVRAAVRVPADLFVPAVAPAAVRAVTAAPAVVRVHV